MTDPMVVLNPVQEETYLASLLTSSTARTLREDALGKVSPDDFWNASYGALWAIARQLLADGKPLTRRALVANANSPAASVEQLLWALSQDVPQAAEYPGALAEVQRCGKLRRLWETLTRAMQGTLACATVDEGYTRALSFVHEQLAKLDDTDTAGGSRAYGVLLDEFEEAMNDHTQYQIIETPWAELNKHIAGGLHGGRFYVIGARPGNGKSIVAHNMAEFAGQKGFTSQVFSAEMGALEVAGRMVSNGASIEMGEISRRELSEYSWYQFQQYRDTARDYQLYIDSSAELSIGYIRSECAARKRKSGLHVVVVDYLQLVKGDSKVPREQQIAGVSRSLKQLSLELEVAVVVPTQLNRKSSEKDKASMSDLRESGSIEQDADVVVMLARQYADDGDMKGVPNGQVSVEIVKNRHGQEASFELPFRGHYSRIG